MHRQFFDRPDVRKPIPGGHAQDGGYKLAELTQAERQEIRDTLAPHYLIVQRRHDAAVKLTDQVGQIAQYGSNQQLADALAEAQIVYDALTVEYRNSTPPMGA
jgi:hypothetical protein